MYHIQIPELCDTRYHPRLSGRLMPLDLEGFAQYEYGRSDLVCT